MNRFVKRFQLWRLNNVVRNMDYLMNNAPPFGSIDLKWDKSDMERLYRLRQAALLKIRRLNDRNV